MNGYEQGEAWKALLSAGLGVEVMDAGQAQRRRDNDDVMPRRYIVTSVTRRTSDQIGMCDVRMNLGWRLYTTVVGATPNEVANLRGDLSALILDRLRPEVGAYSRVRQDVDSGDVDYRDGIAQADDEWTYFTKHHQPTT